MIKQLLGLTRVFAGDHIHFLEHAQRPQRDVLQIADRRRDQIQRGLGGNIPHAPKSTIGLMVT